MRTKSQIKRDYEANSDIPVKVVSSTSKEPTEIKKRARTRGQIKSDAEEVKRRRLEENRAGLCASDIAGSSSSEARVPSAEELVSLVSATIPESSPDSRTPEEWNWKSPPDESLNVSLRQFIKDQNKLPYNPLDRRSKNRYELSSIEAEHSSQAEPPYLPISERFLHSGCRTRYMQYRKRNLHDERYVPLGLEDARPLMDIIMANGLKVTESYVREIVLEFYGRSGMGRRNIPVPDHVFGVSLVAYLKKTATQLLDIAARIEGKSFISY